MRGFQPKRVPRIVTAITTTLAPAERGIAAVEFALILPFLFALYFGGMQLTDAIAAYRKVTVATRSVADLATQYTSLTNTDLDKILRASRQVMAPYDVAHATLIVSEVKIDADGNPTIAWSRALNGAAREAGTSFELPQSIVQPGTWVVVSEVSYRYAPAVAKNVIGPFTMRDAIIMNPRHSGEITFKAEQS